MRTFGISIPAISKHRVFQTVAGGIGIGLGLTAAAICSPGLLVTIPHSPKHAVKSFLGNPALDPQSDFELGTATLAFALGDAIVDGAEFALRPILGGLSIAVLGARIMVNAE